MTDEGRNIFNKNMGRRSFLKGTAAAAAITGTAVAGPGNTIVKALAAGDGTSAAAAEEKVYTGVCRGECVGGCALSITVRDGKVVKVMPAEMPDPAYTRCCLKGLTHTQLMYDSHRLKYPMKRAGERGEGKWEQITWEEAIQITADNLKRLREQYGPRTIADHQTSPNMGELAVGAPSRFLNLLGTTRLTSCADMTLAKVTLQMLGMGKMWTTTEKKSIQNAKTVVVWGSNLTEAVVQDWRFVANAKEKGAKLYTIASSFTTIAAKSEKFLPIKPATDAILAMAMTNIVIAEDLIDIPFMQQSTVAPFLVKESDGQYLRLSDIRQLAEGETDAPVVRDAQGKTGLPAEIPDPVLEGSFEINGMKVHTAYELLKKRIAEWTPERAAEMCELEISDIYEMARVIGTDKPVAAAMGYGPDRYANGHYAYYAIGALLAVTGNLGQDGTQFCYPFPLGSHYTNALIYHNPHDPAGAKTFSIPQTNFYDVMMEEKFGDTPVKITGLFMAAGNMITTTPDRNKTLEAFDKIEFIACTNLIMTDSAQYADIILPVTHWFEYTDIQCSRSMLPYAVIQEKAVEPLYECKSDFEIMNLLAKAMGLGEYFTMTDEETIQYILDTNGARGMGITWETMKQKKYIRCYEEPLYIHGAGGKFPTPTGRVQFYNEKPAPDFNYGQKIDVEKERLPSWAPPAEAWEGSELYTKYPLIYNQMHQRWRTHTTFGHVEWLRELDPEPAVRINSKDAEARGIKNGDVVKVFNDRGYAVVKAIIHNGIRPGIVSLPHGWQRGQFIEGHYVNMTSRHPEPYIATGTYGDALVEVMKM